MLMPEPEVVYWLRRSISGVYLGIFFLFDQMLNCARFARAAKRGGGWEVEFWGCRHAEASRQVLLQDSHRVRHQHTRWLLCAAPPRWRVSPSPGVCSPPCRTRDACITALRFRKFGDLVIFVWSAGYDPITSDTRACGKGSAWHGVALPAHLSW